MADELQRVETGIPFQTNGTDLTEIEPGLSFAMINWTGLGDQLVPPYWSRARDAWLREFVSVNDPLKAATNTFVNKVVSIPFMIQARDRSIGRHVRSAAALENNLRRNSGSMSSTVMRGFKQTLKMFTQDVLTQDNGGFMLVLGGGRADGPIVGPPIGLLHLDSACCVRTRDHEFPVKYHNIGAGGDGKEYKIHYTRIIEMANLPSSTVDLNGVGLSPVSCCLGPAQELWDVWKYSQEMFGSRPPRQILYAKTGATAKQLDDAVKIWAAKLNTADRSRFGGTLLAGPRISSQTLELDSIPLSAMPDNYDRADVTTINLSMIAAAFGLDLRDLAYTLGAPSRTGDAQIQDKKGRGKGVGEFVETLTERLNMVFLNANIHEFMFDYLDDDQDEQRANIRDRRSQARERDLRSGVTSERVERELMVEAGEISREQFEDMELMDGRLPEGLDVLLLFQSQDRDYQTWLDLGVGDPTNVIDHDALAMSDMIHDRYIEVSRYIFEEANAQRRRKARQALAALDKLRSLYQTPEGQMIDEQATLEAMDAGADQMEVEVEVGQEDGQEDALADAASDEAVPDDEDATKDAALAKQTPEAELLLSDYETQFVRLVERAQAREIDRDEFVRLMEELIRLILLSLFLQGARTVPEQMTLEAREAVLAQMELAFASLEGFADDIYGGRYDEDDLGIAGAVMRVAGWITVASGVYYLGQLFRPDDPYLRWVINPFKEHCSDCVRLDGQVHTASEWRAAGWRPRAWNLECRGIHCGCSFVEADGPAVGAF